MNVYRGSWKGFGPEKDEYVVANDFGTAERLLVDDGEISGPETIAMVGRCRVAQNTPTDAAAEIERLIEAAKVAANVLWNTGEHVSSSALNASIAAYREKAGGT